MQQDDGESGEYPPVAAHSTAIGAAADAIEVTAGWTRDFAEGTGKTQGDLTSRLGLQVALADEGFDQSG